MKKLIKLFAVLACAALLCSCGNIAGDQAGTTQADARIVLNISGPADRTAYAPVTTANFTNIKIDYKKTGSTVDYANLVTYTNAAAISTAVPVCLVPDTYDLVISANAGGFVYKVEKPAVTLVSGTNTINADLVLTGMETPVGTGTFELTLTVPDGLITDSVSYIANCAYFSVYQDDTVLTGFENVACTASPVDTENHTITFKAVTPAGLAGGMYDVVISVYTDSYRTFSVASYEDSIQIVDNLKTEKAYTRESLTADPDSLSFGTIGGENATNAYVINGTKMYIGGTGELQSASDENVFENIEEVYIGDGITVIGSDLFSESDVKKVTGCKDVTKIEGRAFKDCEALEEIPAFNSVTEIGFFAFSGCTALVEINGFANLTTMNINTFAGCTALEEVKGFDALPVIKDNAFNGCTSLTKLPAFASVTKICSMAFKDCTALEELPAFANVTELCGCVFQGCTGLKYVGKIKHSENDVEVSVFDNVTTIGGMVFYNCNAIEEINGFNALTGSAFPSYLKTASSGSRVKYVKGFNSLTAIPDNAFDGNNALESIEGFANATRIGREAFYHCDAFTELPAFEKVETIDNQAFQSCISLTEINGFNAVETIGNNAFTGCTALESVSGFASLATIGNRAFMNCTNLTSFDFASNSYVIGASAFKNCTGLDEIIIPAAVSAIDYDAFCLNNASSITILNPEIVIRTGFDHFASRIMEEEAEQTTPFTGEFHFAGTEAQWKIAIGYNAETDEWPLYGDAEGTYETTLSAIGLAEDIEVLCSDTAPATNE